MREGSATVTAQAYNITVGSGGNSQQNGANSTFDSVTALGGGKGGDWYAVGTAGGSGGGGGGNNRAGGTATSGQGSRGGDGSVSGAYDAAAGGGGKGAVGGSAGGGTAGNGGAGTISTITGSSVAYAGGGGGGGQAAGGTGGSGIGGNGGSSGNQNGADGAINTGSGGGGAGGSGLGGKGGSGIVIVRYVVGGVVTLREAPVLKAGADSVSGGVSEPYNVWRQTNFTAAQLTNMAYSGTTADPDHDGLNNEQECWAGTSPTNPLSCLILYAPTNNSVVAGKFVVRWQSVAGKTYTVQAATNLVAVFTNLMPTNIMATSDVNVYTDNVPNAVQRFYRVKVETGN
jgi:hypothetical protein